MKQFDLEGIRISRKVCNITKVFQSNTVHLFHFFHRVQKFINLVLPKLIPRVYLRGGCVFPVLRIEPSSLPVDYAHDIVSPDEYVEATQVSVRERHLPFSSVL